ncbi:MAG: hypothetical protein OZ921_11610 [Sorangiineae bacterium]|nr:hypothetical protein [Polyangiaceae bacterium]MEB2323153.1 hypothetical protein [Sorangiineae bacterium]
MLARGKMKLFVAAAGVATTIAVLAASSLADSPGEASRYPYDPVCSWGRLANGKGMMSRCITRAEAEWLERRGDGGAPPAAPAPSAAPAPPASAGEPDAGRAAPTPEQAELEVQVGPVTADEGSLPQAEKKLGVPKDRYAECVKKNGGLSAPTGEVTIRFLVRSRGRAEGVSVARSRSVSAEGAHCIADVIDRRYVGTPAAPMVGASVVVKFSRRK